MLSLAPSEIHFLRDAALDPGTLAPLRFSEEEGDLVPRKVQVAEKDGSWFALNNSYLHVVKELERRGRCPRIHAEVVPLHKVPPTLQRGMVCRPCFKDSDPNEWSHHCSASSHECEADDDDDTSSCTSSEYSEDEEEETSGSELDDNLVCKVCDRSFSSAHLLSQHQQRERHFGCSVCDSCFPNVRGLETHKESLDHWSDDDTFDSDQEETDDRQKTATEAERLL